MLNIIKLSLFIAIIIAIGWCFLYLIIRRRSDLFLAERMALSYGLGIGLVSLEMLIFYLCGLNFNAKSILLPWIVVGVASVVLSLRASRSEAKQSINSHLKDCFVATRAKLGLLAMTKKIRPLTALLIVALVLQIAFVFFCAFIKPIESYDAVAIYAIKSKIFYLANSIPSDYFTRLAHYFPHPDYPLNIPLIQSFFYIFTGSLNDQAVKIIYPLFYVGILMLFYCSVRRFSSRIYSLLYTFMLATIPQFSAFAGNAYLEVPLSFYCFASVLFLLKWFMDTKSIAYLILSAIMVAFAGWTKNEGMMYCAINVFLVVMFLIANFKRLGPKSMFFFAIYVGVIFLTLLPWLWVKKSTQLVNSDVSFSIMSIKKASLSEWIHKLQVIFYGFQKQFFGLKRWNMVWSLSTFIIIIYIRRALVGVGKYIAFFILLAICGYIFTYLVSDMNIVFFVNRTWARFLLHFLPIVVYWLAYTLKDEQDLKT